MRALLIVSAFGLTGWASGSTDAGAKFNFATEGLFTSDVQMTDTTSGALWPTPGGEATLTLGWNRLVLDYSSTPGDLITRAVSRTETRRSAQFDARREFGPRWTVLAAGGFYRGFGDHRSVWVDEHDRQLFAGARGYAPAAPQGWHAATGARWAWRPGGTFFQAMLARHADTVAPGYEPQIGGPLLRGRERLHTSSANFSLEHIATAHVRLRFDGSAADTSGRARRYTIVGSANWTPAEQWVLRAAAGATREAPTLHAGWLQLALDRDWANRWFAGILVRGYRDRGEVLDPLVSSSAAPALRTLHTAASLRWQNARHAVRLEVGPYRTRYAALPPAAWQFARLYRDRSWLRVQAAFQGEFWNFSPIHPMKKYSLPLRWLVGAALLSISPFALAQGVDTGGTARNFTLRNRATGQAVSLYDFAGKIVVLDFFAYWCPPCQVSSPELEQNVQAYYAARGGNASGLPVVVMEVNIESANPALTDAFVRQVQASLVVDDLQRVAYNQFLVGESAIPRFVIINGASNSTTHRPWQVVKNTVGWGGANSAAGFRQLIDGVRAAAVVPPPVITTQPQALHVSPGAGAVFTAAASGTGLDYQWKKNGTAIPGATSATYAVASVRPVDTGFYSVAVSAGGATTDSSVAILTLATGGASRLANLSTRGLVPSVGDLTVGFVIRGSGGKSLLVRAVGPTLGSFGVAGALADPTLDVIPAGASVAVSTNDDWAGGAALAGAFAGVGAFALPTNSKDAAVLASLPVAGYTARITSSVTGGSGLALAEVYDRDAAGAGSQLVNVSTRGFVGTGAQALTPGFVIAGTAAKQLLIRAIGPGLAQFGVSGTLADPQLAVIPLGQTFTIASNDNWDGTAATTAAFMQAGAFALTPGSKDAALLVRLPPGGYTVTVSGVGSTTGTALVEVYDLDP